MLINIINFIKKMLEIYFLNYNYLKENYERDVELYK